MGLFCGKTCECKRRCKADLAWAPDLIKGCKNACKGDDSLDGDLYFQSLPANVQATYMVQGDLAAELQQPVETQAVPVAVFIFLGLIILGLAWYFLKN